MKLSKIRKSYGSNEIESCKCSDCLGIIVSVSAGYCIKEGHKDE